MLRQSILNKGLSCFLVIILAITIIPGDLKTWPNNISNPVTNLAYASYNTPLGGTNKTVVLLPFEGNVLDSSSNHNNGLVTGNAKYVPGKIGNYAFSFDGLTHITLANPSQFAFEKSNPFTISFWMKMAPSSSTDMYLVSNANTPTSPGISIFKSHLSNGLTFKVVNKYSTAFQVSSSYNVSNNAWHMVMCTYDGSGNQKGMKIYIDGALQAVGTASSISSTIVTSLSETIGSTVSGSSPFVGTIDNLQILNYLLSPSNMANFWSKPQLFSPVLFTPIMTKSGVSLSWLPVIGAVGYNVYRDGVLLTSTLEPSPSFFDFGLGSSTTHSYKITAVNSTGGASPFSQINATTTSTSLNTPLRVGIFTPNITTATLNVLKANYQKGDGLMVDRIPYIEQVQDYLKIPGLRHFPYSPHIGPISSCDLGSVASMSQQTTQAIIANQSGYVMDSIVYDIEGWCWTPQIEQTNYVSAIDNASKIAHLGGFKSGLVATHAELLKWYPNIHWKNVDYLYVQYHKSLMTKESNYTLVDPKYISDVTDLINFARSQNPSIKIFLNYSFNWEDVGSMIYAINQFKNKIQGVILYDLPANNPNNLSSPHPTWNSPTHQNQFLKAVKSM